MIYGQRNTEKIKFQREAEGKWSTRTFGVMEKNTYRRFRELCEISNMTADLSISPPNTAIFLPGYHWLSADDGV